MSDELVDVQLDYDSGPFPSFSLVGRYPGKTIVRIPKSLWDQYEAASALARKLEYEIEGYEK